MKRKRSSNRVLTGENATPPKWRSLFIASFVLLFFAVISYRALDLQAFNRDRAFDVGKRQHNGAVTLPAQRGRILDRDKKELAVSVDVKSIYAHPSDVREPEKVAQILSKKLNVSPKRVLNRVSSNKSFVWLKRLADPKVIASLQSLNLEGIGYLQESKRVYPNGHLLGQVIGFTNIDSRGIEGIEHLYDNFLTGTPQKITLVRDAKGRGIMSVSDKAWEFDRRKTSGADVVLTIDSRIQHIVERELEKGVEEMAAEKGMALLLNPETGEVLAMASYPFLDPNDFIGHPKETMRSLPIWYAYEPGSTIKVFLAAAALEEGKVNLNSVFDCENGRRVIGSEVIKDTSLHNNLTVAEIIEVSSNVCASKIGELLGKEKYYYYLDKFGFGEKTGIDLPGESKGIFTSMNKWGDIELATISFGQGISVTTIQMASALSAIANGGDLMKPYIVKRIASADGEVLQENKPRMISRIMSYDTAREVTDIMKRVVENGTGQKAAIPGIAVAGKTGTAQIPDLSNGGYHSGSYIASFIGFAPADAPRMALIVVVKSPKKKLHGGAVAAPIFRSIAEKSLFVLGVTPSQETLSVKAMPDLRGMDAREILKWSEKEGVRVKVKGNGYVKNQMPLPGEPIKRGMICSVEMDRKT